MSHTLKYAGLIIITILAMSCKKDWLEEKSNINLAIPSTIDDFEALLDNIGIFNRASPGLGEMSTDDYFLTEANWAARSFLERNTYLFSKETFETNSSALDWNSPYNKIYNCNLILQEAAKLENTNESRDAINNIFGNCLFHRAYSYFELAQVFTLPYSSSISDDILGLPLRLSPDFAEKSVRSNLKATYERILQDAKASANLLPLRSKNKFRPNKSAVFGLLARICLVMKDYESSYLYADSSIKNYDGAFMNFNDLSASSNTPILRLNSEIIFDGALTTYASISGNVHSVDSMLYKEYVNNDLRKTIFFRNNAGRMTFKGSYLNTANTLFSGIALDEMYLIRAEASARLGRTSEALADLNTMLKTRWNKAAVYPNITATSAEDALNKVLAERRKELIFRGTRWWDLRRLADDNRFKATVTRVINGATYKLEPGSPNYALPIPLTVIQLSGMQQNPRN